MSRQNPVQMTREQIAARLADGRPPLTVGQVAAITGWSRAKVQRLIDGGFIAAAKERYAKASKSKRWRQVPAPVVRRLAQDLGVI